VHVRVALFARSWSELAPAAWLYDAARVRELTGEVLARLGRPRNDTARAAMEDAIDRALVVELGVGVCGWRWSTGESGDGGLVRSWCCAPHALFGKSERNAAQAEARVAAAVAEWRQVVTDLEQHFDELRVRTAGLVPGEAIEVAAAQLLPYVVARNGAEDAWHRTLGRVLGWFLEAAGHDAAALQATLDEVLGGHFASWVAPDEAVARAAFAELRQAVASAPLPPRVPDALAAWLRVRAAPRLLPRQAPAEPVRHDGHRRFVRRELAQDGARAARFMLALDECRASAARGERLEVARLRAWQALVLGVDEVPLRAGAAWAKAGRERYGRAGELLQKLEQALGEAEDASLPACVRAARVYLDVCFFHPFADGNARAARLALDHVLTRAGLGLHAVEPLFCVARAAGDAQGLFMMAELLRHLSGPIAYAP
jgi:hypothetical protein